MSLGCNCRCRCRHSHPHREMWGKRASTFPHQAGDYRSLSKLGRAYHNQERPSSSGSCISPNTMLAASIYCGLSARVKTLFEPWRLVWAATSFSNPKAALSHRTPEFELKKHRDGDRTRTADLSISRSCATHQLFLNPASSCHSMPSTSL